MVGAWGVHVWCEPTDELVRTALAELSGEKQLEIVPGATHLFEEPGTLERVAPLAADWLGRDPGGKAAARAA